MRAGPHAAAPGAVGDAGIGEAEAELVVRARGQRPLKIDAAVGVEVDQVAVVRAAGHAGEHADAALVLSGNFPDLLLEHTGIPTLAAVCEARAAAVGVIGVSSICFRSRAEYRQETRLMHRANAQTSSARRSRRKRCGAAGK